MASTSEATFASAETDQDISIDDPDFWKKWAKKAQIEELDEKTQLMMVEPRQRKQINYHNINDSAPLSDLDSSDDEDESSLMSRSRDQKIKDKLRSLQHGRGGLARKKKGRSMWDGDDDDYMETERDVEYGSWSKADLFRLEKAVMTFGWGRWEDVLSQAGLRKGWSHVDVEVRTTETLHSTWNFQWKVCPVHCIMKHGGRTVDSFYRGAWAQIDNGFFATRPHLFYFFWITF